MGGFLNAYILAFHFIKKNCYKNISLLLLLLTVDDIKMMRDCEREKQDKKRWTDVCERYEIKKNGMKQERDNYKQYHVKKMDRHITTG